MIFDTKVNGIPCKCRVIEYTPYRPMQVYGSGQGDAHPPEPEEFIYQILDRRGRPAPWLEKYLTEADDERLLREFHLALESQ